MYNNHYSAQKEYTRNIVYNLVRTYKRKEPLNVLTLPSTNFVLEEKLLELDNVKLTCTENDPIIHSAQKKHFLYREIKKSGDFRFKDAFTLVRESHSKFGVIWLDLCGGFGNTNLNNIFSLVQSNKLEKEAYVALTLMKGREKDSEKLHSFYGYKSMKKFREGFPDLVIEFAEMKKNRQCRLVHKFEYINSSPMMFLVFKITNN